jgi:hypothetical protein
VPAAVRNNRSAIRPFTLCSDDDRHRRASACHGQSSAVTVDETTKSAGGQRNMTSSAALPGPAEQDDVSSVPARPGMFLPPGPGCFYRQARDVSTAVSLVRMPPTHPDRPTCSSASTRTARWRPCNLGAPESSSGWWVNGWWVDGWCFLIEGPGRRTSKTD